MTTSNHCPLIHNPGNGGRGDQLLLTSPHQPPPRLRGTRIPARLVAAEIDPWWPRKPTASPTPPPPPCPRRRLRTPPPKNAAAVDGIAVGGPAVRAAQLPHLPRHLGRPRVAHHRRALHGDAGERRVRGLGGPRVRALLRVAHGRRRHMDADCLVEIFRRLPLDDVAAAAPLVCRSWRAAARDASLWRALDLRGGGGAAARFMPWSPLAAAFAALRRPPLHLRGLPPPLRRARRGARRARPPAAARRARPGPRVAPVHGAEEGRPPGAVRRRRRAAARPRRAVAPPRAPGARAQAGVVPGDGGARRRRLPRLLQPQDGRRHPRRGRRGHGGVAAAPQAPLPRRLLPAKARAPRRHPWLPRAGVAEREALRGVRRGRRGGGEGGRHDREARGWRVEIGRQV
ncbi:hypothetical protein EE612_060851 [Oryza sativa]|nr:hypothetical protein EE612_060851 [Oryza sativa]